jgi:hypothetical protein
MGNGLGAVPERGPDRFGGQGREGQRPQEMGGAACHHRAHEGAGVNQPATQFDRFVRRDPAAHSQDDAAPDEGRTGLNYGLSPYCGSSESASSPPSGAVRL